MNARTMKYIGIAVMVLAHPVGFYFWDFILRGPIYNNSSFDWAHFGVLQGIGILGFFQVGLSLFVIGVVKDNKEK